ncbi:MAG: 3-dehydroquinate synthase [Actinomycetales bacterium]|nr:MAG: 3-dehydroquinate synthase [Actinomycetales bacterium]
MTEPANGLTRVPVGTDYDVLVGRGARAAIAGSLPDRAAKVLVVSTDSVQAIAESVTSAIRAAGREVLLELVPDAEAAKTAAVAAGLWARLGQAGFTRSDAVVGVGGGAVTDLAGFVAATWLRGVALVQVPTSLAGMVDAAIGGKTGINTGEGKNLVGAFYPPGAVLCDIDTLATLPPAELVTGMAEVVKHGFIADPTTLELIEADPAAAVDPGGSALPDLVVRSVRVKARVVAADLREASLREILNYGHTFGHAIEQVEGYTWRHGHAVAVGLRYAATLGALAGRTPAALVTRHTEILAALGLPVHYPDADGSRWPQLLAAMRVDKKSRGSLLRFVVLDDLAQPGRLEGPDEQLLRTAYDVVRGTGGRAGDSAGSDDSRLQ